MSKRNEKLSAYLDGEIHQDELMSFSLSGEEADAKTAMRYQLVGDVLRGETSELSTFDISGAVREALANENIADQMPQQAVESGSNHSGSNHKVASGGLFGWLSFRPVAGMAMAVTVAAVMVLSVSQQESQSTTPMASNEITPVASNEIESSATAVAIAAHPQPLPALVIQHLPPQLAIAPVAPAQSVPASYNPTLNPYLNQHFATQGSFAQSTLQNRMPYVRSVSLEPEK